MLNRIDLMGRLTIDPELRMMPAGVPVTTFTLAVERDVKDKTSGEKKTDFIDVVCFRGAAEFATKYLSKGRLTVVSGRLQIREWKDKSGNNRRSAEVIAESLYFADAKRENTQAPAAAAPASHAAPNDFTMFEDDSTDLPF